MGIVSNFLLFKKPLLFLQLPPFLHSNAVYLFLLSFFHEILPDVCPVYYSFQRTNLTLLIICDMSVLNLRKISSRSSHHGSEGRNLTSIHEDAGQIPALLIGLSIQHCSELWCRSQTWLRSYAAVAVVQAGSNSSNSTPSLGTSICCRS